MCQITRVIALLVLVLPAACRTPGYRVDIGVENVVSSIDVLARLQRIAKDNGFVVLEEGYESPRCSGELISAYEKKLSEAPHDWIEIYLLYSDVSSCGKYVRLWVAQRLRGNEQDVKAQVDALGDMYYKELAGIFGSERVVVRRGPTSVGMGI